MLEPRADHTAVAFGDNIFIAGGRNKQAYIGEEPKYLNTIDVFTLPDSERPLGQWTRLANWDTGRRPAALVVCQSRLFSFGKSCLLPLVDFAVLKGATNLFPESETHKFMDFLCS
ncbi:unnamed protein product [Dibothriocephalus latus]|uniref:Uncharacterized protein n=1 Tax=Dibothriocephalus latus TaxID=60516 RepID=A0A3P7NH98_DIBLA|nr:unnamed protein product [Dibothriocephalus latus]